MNDIDEELALPSELRYLSDEAKETLLEFKRSHNEVCLIWPNLIVKCSERMGRRSFASNRTCS